MTPQQTKIAIGAGVVLLLAVGIGQLARHQSARAADEKARASAADGENGRSSGRAFNIRASGDDDESANGRNRNRAGGSGGSDDGIGTARVSAIDMLTSDGEFVETEAETLERERYEKAQREAFKYRKLDANKIKPTPLQPAFDDATKEYNLPEHLLAAIAYVETGGTHRDGSHSMEAGYGVMNLRESNLADTVAEAAALRGKTKEDLFYDQYENILGGAALISRYYEDALASGVGESEALYLAVSMYTGRPDPELAAALADEVAGWLIKGFTINTPDGGGTVVVPPNPNPPFLPKNWKLVGLEPPGGASQPDQANQ